MSFCADVFEPDDSVDMLQSSYLKFRDPFQRVEMPRGRGMDRMTAPGHFYSPYSGVFWTSGVSGVWPTQVPSKSSVALGVRDRKVR